MSAHATGGTRPSAAAPAGEPPTVEGASAASVEPAPAAAASTGAAPAGASESTAGTTGSAGATTGSAAGTTGSAGATTGSAAGTTGSAAETAQDTTESTDRTAQTADRTADTTDRTAQTADRTAQTAEGRAETAEAGAGADADEADAEQAPSAVASPDLTAVGDGATTMVFGDEPEPMPDGTEPVSKLAILALITGLVALVPIAVAVGIASLRGIRRTGRRGRGMAMAGLILSATWVIVAAAVAAVGLVTHGFHKPVTVKYREAAVFKLQEGDCVDSPNAQLVSVLPCSTPHQAEVFATFLLTGSRWPGASAIATEASSGCTSRLNGYLNPQITISLSQSYVFPDQVAWSAGTRTVVCEVRASNGDLTGSVRDTTLPGSNHLPIAAAELPAVVQDRSPIHRPPCSPPLTWAVGGQKCRWVGAVWRGGSPTAG
jgi:Domain of unknown function (DUF4190)/Septum formation